MPADHVGEAPPGRCHELAAGHDRKLDRMSCPDAAGSLISVGNAIEFDAGFAGRNALDRELDIEEAERRVIAGAIFVEIERADLSAHAWTEFALPRHLRIGPR